MDNIIVAVPFYPKQNGIWEQNGAGNRTRADSVACSPYLRPPAICSGIGDAEACRGFATVSECHGSIKDKTPFSTPSFLNASCD